MDLNQYHRETEEHFYSISSLVFGMKKNTNKTRHQTLAWRPACNITPIASFITCKQQYLIVIYSLAATKLKF